MLCTFHHHLVHEGGWTITAAADGARVFHSPLGNLLAQEPPTEHVDNCLAWLHEWAEERNLGLGPDVNMPLGDGTKPNYDMAVSGLLAAG
jgi:hypothetical protein